MDEARQRGDPAVMIGNEREVQCGTLGTLYVAGPFMMPVDWIDRQAHDLDPALVEFGLEPRDGAKFGGADGREILWVREQHDPVVAGPSIEGQRSDGRILCEIGDRIE